MPQNGEGQQANRKKQTLALIGAALVIVGLTATITWLVVRGTVSPGTTVPPPRIKESLAAMLAEHRVDPLPQLGGQLEPGTLLTVRDGRVYLLAEVDDAYENPGALRPPTGPTEVVASASCEDRISFEADVKLDLLAFLGLDTAKAHLRQRAVVALGTRLVGLERVEVSTAKLDAARLEPDHARELGGDGIVLAQVVWRVRELEVDFRTETETLAEADVTAIVGTLGASSGASTTSAGAIRYANKVLGCYPALRVAAAATDPQETQRLAESLRAAGVETETGAAGLVALARPQQIQLVRSVVAQSRARHSAQSETNRVRAQLGELEGRVRAFEDLRRTLGEPEVGRELHRALRDRPDGIRILDRLGVRR